ncbi:MAG: major facilitator superfamily 1 [Firmicutes bacterium]|nr:major facilitator superfamily 1 [Bacillota bacterium]
MQTDSKPLGRINNYFDGLPVSTVHKILFFIIMMSYFFEQMDNWNFGFIAPVLMKNWGLTMADIGKVNFYYFLAMTLGGLTGGVISDFIGRRKTFLGAIVVFSVGSIISGFATDLFTIIWSRAMTGFGVFCLMVCSQAYLAEISPAETRGKWQGLVAAVGFTAAPLVGGLCRWIIPMSPEAWRYIFFFGGLGLVGFLVGLRYLKESPRWLVAQKRVTEAEQVIEDLSGIRVDLSEVAAKVEVRHSPVEVFTGMFSAKYLKRTLVLLIWVAFTVPATFIVTVWTPTLLNKHGLSVEDSLMASFILMIGVPVGCYIASLISDKGGRKIPLCATAVAITIFGLIFSQLTSFWPLTIAGFCLISSVMANGFITFSYIAESYPTKMRNTATGIQMSAGRLATSFMQPVVPIVFAGYGFFGVYGLVASLCVLPLLVVLVWGIRTGGKSLEEIS